jgi:undecaprenyl phosphate-alpha-L-ara4N flippase subunit ArnE
MKVAAAFLAMVSLTVAANLLLKTGATSTVGSGWSFLAILNWRSMLGLASFGCAGVIYAILLRWLPLNVAQSFAAIQFVGVIVASALVLSEPISRPQWIGILMIAAGIATVGWSRYE